MIIDELRPGTGDFKGQIIKLGAGVNIVRGANGVGKTLLLEYCSLLGHVAVMDRASLQGSPPPSPNLQMSIRLSESDKEFLSELRSETFKDTIGVKALDIYEQALASKDLSLEVLRKAPIPDGPIVLSFYFEGGVSEVNLKEVLAKESRIASDIRIAGVYDQVSIIQSLIFWSRPLWSTAAVTEEGGPDGVWSITPRLVRGLSALNQEGPGAVFYVNTDMYDFGVGLDIRESPKHIQQTITPVLIDRLQLVTCDTDQYRSGLKVSETLRQTGHEELLCKEDFQRSWRRIFGDDPSPKVGQSDGSESGCSISIVRRGRDIKWQFTIDGTSRGDFVSSGENQALFLLAVLNGLAGSGSCMLLDEPDLHLTPRAAVALMEEIFSRVAQKRCQAIVVTHLSHLYRSRLPRDPDVRNQGYGKVSMIYIERNKSVEYGLAAVNRAANASYMDVWKLVEGLALERDIPLLPFTFRATIVQRFWTALIKWPMRLAGRPPRS